MATNNSAVQLEMLTQGSVWKRNVGKFKGKEVKFLFLTNSNLPAKGQLKHPPQVIYVDEKNAIYNRELDSFLSAYTFYNVDSDLESKLESLFVFNESLIEDDEEEIEYQIPEGSDQESVEEAQVQPAETETQVQTDIKAKTVAELWLEPAEDAVKGSFIISKVPGYENPPSIDEKQLALAFVGYSQEPLLSHGLLGHRLTFKQTDNITVESIDRAFAPNDHVNTVESFIIQHRDNIQQVLWTTWLGVYPQLTLQGNFLTVLVATDDLPLTANDGQQETDIELDAEHQDVLTNMMQELGLSAFGGSEVEKAETETGITTEAATTEQSVLAEAPVTVHVTRIEAAVDHSGINVSTDPELVATPVPAVVNAPGPVLAENPALVAQVAQQVHAHITQPQQALVSPVEAFVQAIAVTNVQPQVVVHNQQQPFVPPTL